MAKSTTPPPEREKNTNKFFGSYVFGSCGSGSSVMCLSRLQLFQMEKRSHDGASRENGTGLDCLVQ